MGQCLKITAVLFLLVQAFHLVFLQTSTNSPRRTIDPSYLRQHAKKTHVTLKTEEMEYEPVSDLGNDYSGIASGSMALFTEEDNVPGQDKPANKTDVTATVAPTFFTNVTTNQTASTSAVTTVSANSITINSTETRVESQNVTTATTTQNSTSLSPQNSTNQPRISNHTELQTTTLVPESISTQEPTTNATESTNTTVTATITTNTATTTQQLNETSATFSTTTASSSETTPTSPETTSLETTRETTTETTATPDLLTPEQANKTDKGSASGSSSERGLATESYHNRGHNTWGAVLGTAIAVACLGLVAYIILKKKHKKNFSHRKLVEEFPSDPVLRLDNSAPLDLNFGAGSLAFYNPGLQGDNIQMSNYPGRR